MPYQYMFEGKVVALEAEPGLAAVRFEPGPKSTRFRATAAAGAGPFFMRFEVPGEKLTLIPVSPEVSSGDASIAKALLARQPEVAHVLPVFRSGTRLVVTTDRIVVGVESAEIGAELALKHEAEILESEQRRVVIRIPKGADPFDIIGQIQDEPGVRFVEPDFVKVRALPPIPPSPPPPATDDELFARQDVLRKVRAIEAWDLVEDVSKVRVAVIDLGVQASHPDLRDAIVGSYDATSSPGGQQPNSWDWHGTACAGLVAATRNGVGIRGVAHGASLLAVRIAQGVQNARPGEDWICVSTEMRKGIRWAWQNGAHVLSNSWGDDEPSSDIKEELEMARTEGRGGLGCVIVAAAGNDGGPVAFPANLPNVLAVSASDRNDEPTIRYFSRDDQPWASNYGPEIDVAAPGIDNVTTDLTGADGHGYDDYILNFGGTSSAAPIVAGACALVLCANPSLCEAEVRDIVTKTAAKVGSIPYDGGRNDYLGYGRLDVYAAVTLARAMLESTPPSAPPDSAGAGVLAN